MQLKYLYKQFLLSFLIFLSCSNLALSQLTAQIGTGNDQPYFTQFSPVFWFSPSVPFNNTRSDILFTQAEMQAALIPSGSTIIAIEFNKLTTAYQNNPSTFTMLMNNSSNVALDSSVIAWTYITNTFTQVYNNTSFNLPGTTGWTRWNLQNSFVYTGGALEIATENSMPGGNTPTGNVAWEWTNTTPQKYILGSFNQGSFNNSFNVYRARPNIKIIYYPPQTTVQIGTGNDQPYFTQFSPVFWFSPSVPFNNTRSDILFTQAELQALGIPAGSTITSVQFNKLTTAYQNNPSTFTMLMNNSSNLGLDSSVVTWAGINSGFTQVYNNTSFNLPNTTGWVPWNLQNPFVYTGGALEIATENSMPGGNTPTGNVAWEWTNTTPQKYILGSFNQGSFNNSFNVYRARPNIKITYYPPACAAPSGTPTVTNITNVTAKVNWSAVSNAVGYQYAVTTSSTAPSSGINIVGTSVNLSGLTPLTQYYVHVRTNCGSGYSLFWSTASFTTLEPCPKPSIPIVSTSTTTNIANISWHPSPFGAFGYQYAVSTNATPPASGTATTDTSFVATGLLGSTQYYVHVKANCNAQGFSSWVTKPFITPCFVPAPTVTSNIKSGMADFVWLKTAGTVNYEYAITTSVTPPVSGTTTNDTVYHTVNLDGGTTYYFHVRSYCGSGVSSWATIAFNTPGLEAYPNPVKETLRINLNGLSINNGQITIGNANGQVVKRLQLTSNTTTVDTRGWASGIYLIRYDDGKNKYTLRIMKQ